jgi:hypothetical protein
MYIQYVGFDVAASSRIYTFHVIDVPDATRDFTVEVQSEVFRPNRLKVQDGPGICFARVERELQGQTQETRAEAHLCIREQDITEYMERHHPQKPHAKKEER